MVSLPNQAGATLPGQQLLQTVEVLEGALEVEQRIHERAFRWNSACC